MNELTAHIPSVSFREMEKLAYAIAKSNLFGIKMPEQALTLMAIAQAEGRHPALAARDYDIIDGKPSKKSEAMLRDFIAAGGKVTWHKYADDGADATFSHPTGGTVRVDWDMERVKAAGLANKPMWTKYRRPMFRARVISEGIRTVYSAASSGMYAPEELRDASSEAHHDGVIEGTATDLGSAAASPSADAPSKATAKGAEISRGNGSDATKIVSKINGWLDALSLRLMSCATADDVAALQGDAEIEEKRAWLKDKYPSFVGELDRMFSKRFGELLPPAGEHQEAETNA